jgi:hypothetical protein
VDTEHGCNGVKKRVGTDMLNLTPGEHPPVSTVDVYMYVYAELTTSIMRINQIALYV